MHRQKLNLHELTNPSCKKCAPMEREQNTCDGLCSLAASIMDEGRARCVGGWSYQKIYFLTQYFGIFATGMKNKWDLHYIELCSGPGRCIDRESGIEMDGTALAVLDHDAFKHLHSATFLDNNPAVVSALNDRVKERNLLPRAQAIEADYNNSTGLAEIISRRVQKGLSLVFIDPTDCSVPFATVAAMAKILPKVDFIINIAIGTDATRNIKQAILKADGRAREKYVRFFAGNTFFADPEIIRLAKTDQNEQLRTKIREHYRLSMETLGYKHFELERVKHYYELLFASRHEQGLTFWKKAQKYKPDNQGTLDL